MPEVSGVDSYLLVGVDVLILDELGHFLGDHVHLLIVLSLLVLHLSHKLFSLFVKSDVLTGNFLDGLLGRSKHAPSLVSVFFLLEGVLELVEHVIDVSAFVDLNSELLNFIRHLGHVGLDFGKLLNVLGNLYNLEVLSVKFSHDPVGDDFGLFGNKLDLSLSNFEMLVGESGADRFAVNLEHGDNDRLRDLLLKLLGTLSTHEDVTSESIGLWGVLFIVHSKDLCVRIQGVGVSELVVGLQVVGERVN